MGRRLDSDGVCACLCARVCICMVCMVGEGGSKTSKNEKKIFIYKPNSEPSKKKKQIATLQPKKIKSEKKGLYIQNTLIWLNAQKQSFQSGPKN